MDSFFVDGLVALRSAATKLSTRMLPFLASQCTGVTQIILKIEIGNWDGGHNGLFAKLIEWDLNDEQYPISESEGWGHGVSGGRSTLLSFIGSSRFALLKGWDSDWAHGIIKKTLESSEPAEVISQALSIESKCRKTLLPENLCAVLGRWGPYLNA